MLPDDVKALRMFLGWSQERLARELGVSFCTVNRWEKGRSKPSPMALNALGSIKQRYSGTIKSTRMHPRLPLRYPISIKGLEPKKALEQKPVALKPPLTAYTENISAGGVMFMTRGEMNNGDTLLMEINLNKHMIVNAPSQVVWVKRQGENAIVGASFKNLMQADSLKIMNAMLVN